MLLVAIVYCCPRCCGSGVLGWHRGGSLVALLYMIGSKALRAGLHRLVMLKYSSCRCIEARDLMSYHKFPRSSSNAWSMLCLGDATPTQPHALLCLRHGRLSQHHKGGVQLLRARWHERRLCTRPKTMIYSRGHFPTQSSLTHLWTRSVHRSLDASSIA